MLAEALNAVLSLHSRSAIHRRFGPSNTSIAENIRITPSNYFRNLEGPSATIIKGREFIISRASLGGFPQQTLDFGNTEDQPVTSGTYKLGNTSGDTITLDYLADSAAIQAAIRDIDGLEQVVVTGDVLNTIQVSYVGVVDGTPLLNLTANNIVGGTGFTRQVQPKGASWTPLLKRGDKIEDNSPNGTGEHFAIDEIIEMHDLGAALMAWRVRVE